MDVVRTGLALRALRRHLGLRQVDVARRAGVSQQHISDLERGQGSSMSLSAIEGVVNALGARLTLSVLWRGGQLDRLLDEGHAALVAAIGQQLRALGWEVLPEVTYSVFGERGSIDLLAWHAGSRTLLVIEIKTEIASAEELLRRHDVKTRLAPTLARERFGAAPTAVGRLLVVADTPTNRRRAARLDSLLRPVYGLRGIVLRRWLAAPAGAMGGLLFASTARRGARAGRSARPNSTGPSRTARGGD